MRKPIYTHLYEPPTHNQATEHIKWCRRNLGERGSDWDFSGSHKLHIMIYTEKYVPFYKLKFE